MADKTRVVKLTPDAKRVLRELRENNDQVYKWTGVSPAIHRFYKSLKRIRKAIFYELFEKGMLKVYDASACQTWYDLSDLGKTISITD